MKILLSLLITACFLTVGCSSKQVNEAKLSFAEEAGRGVENAFVSVASKNLTGEEYENLNCEEEALYFRLKVTDKVDQILKAKREKRKENSSGIRASMSIAGNACRAVIPFAFQFLLDEGEFKPCSRELTREKLMEVGNMACDFVDEQTK